MSLFPFFGLCFLISLLVLVSLCPHLPPFHLIWFLFHHLFPALVSCILIPLIPLLYPYSVVPLFPRLRPSFFASPASFSPLLCHLSSLFCVLVPSFVSFLLFFWVFFLSSICLFVLSPAFFFFYVVPFPGCVFPSTRPLLVLLL